MKKLLFAIFFICSTAFAGGFPDGYSVIYDINQGTLSQTTLTCTDSGDGCDECADAGSRSFAGGIWDQVAFPGGTVDIYENTDDCSVSISNDCHDVTIVSDANLYGGGTGYGIQIELVGDCNSTSDYSRFERRHQDADPATGDKLEDLSHFAVVFEGYVVDKSAWGANEFIRLPIEIMDHGEDFKISSVLATTISGDCSPGNGGPCFYMKRDSSQLYDNVIKPENNKPFQLVFTYRPDTSSGIWKGTYECPTCTQSSLTTIKDYTGLQTIDTGTTGTLKFPSIAGGGGSNFVEATIVITRLALGKRTPQINASGAWSN